jgi:hypothetical protein
MTARLGCASDQMRLPLKWDVSSPRRSTSRLTIRMAPAEVAFSPSFRITVRQFEESATASVNRESDHVRSNFEGRAMPETVAAGADI